MMLDGGRSKVVNAPCACRRLANRWRSRIGRVKCSTSIREPSSPYCYGAPRVSPTSVSARHLQPAVLFSTVESGYYQLPYCLSYRMLWCTTVTTCSRLSIQGVGACIPPCRHCSVSTAVCPQHPSASFIRCCGNPEWLYKARYLSAGCWLQGVE